MNKSSFRTDTVVCFAVQLRSDISCLGGRDVLSDGHWGSVSSVDGRRLSWADMRRCRLRQGPERMRRLYVRSRHKQENADKNRLSSGCRRQERFDIIRVHRAKV